MLKVEDFGSIRRAYLDLQSIREVARVQGCSRKTVRKALAHAEPPPYQLSSPRPTPVLDPVRALIEAMLAEDEHAPPKQRHTAAQVFRRLRDEHGYSGSYSTVRRHVADQRPRRGETVIPLDHAPGERLECDFGHLYVDLPSGRQKVAVLVCTWGYSNAPFAMAVPSERVEAILAGMVAAFAFYGCVPREVWWDNPKTIATAILRGRERRFHERWLSLASFYCFEPWACMPGKGQEKPRAENRVKDLQRRFAVPVPQVASLDQLNAKLVGFCSDDRGRTIRGRSASIGDQFAQDRVAALPLPPTPFLPAVYQEAVVDKYQQVRFDNVFYSVPPQAAFQTVTVRASIFQVEVVWRQQIIAAHARSYEAHQQILEPRHYLASLQRRPAALDHARVFREWRLPAAFDQLRTALEQRHGPVAGRRHYVGVLRLLLDHSVDEVATIVARHVVRGNLDTGALRLEVERGRLATIHSTLIPEVNVPLPDLRQFDQLLRQGEPTHA